MFLYQPIYNINLFLIDESPLEEAIIFVEIHDGFLVYPFDGSGNCLAAENLLKVRHLWKFIKFPNVPDIDPHRWEILLDGILINQNQL